jgi:hypothetical protein
MKYILSILALSLFISACNQEPTANEVLTKAIKAHGGEQVNNAQIAFDFREIHYKGTYNEGVFELSRKFSDSLGNSIVDRLSNTRFERTINDTIANISDKRKNSYSNSVNSVFYFIKLPFNLKDPAAIINYIGKGYIDGTEYLKLKVSFSEEGGGEDFTDKFVYWFNSETYTLDYLAYEYATDKGGKRFRKAINQRSENGWVINDYINYKPLDIEVDIEQYDVYYAEDGFKKLSEIINRNVEVVYP